MKNTIFILFIISILLSFGACGNTEEPSAPPVALTDIAADAIPENDVVPADENEVAVASEEMILVQPVEAPLPQPASAEPSAEPAAETTAPPA